MELLLLGTGTSVGIPMIGCQCPVCTSADPRNKRRRTSAHLTAGNISIQIDTPPDFREQCLTFGVNHIDAVIFTHAHFDHVFGFDDIRRFNTMQQQIIPIYAAPDTINEIRRIYPYIDTTVQQGYYRPQADFQSVTAPFKIGEVTITPVEVMHGESHTVGYRFDHQGRSLGYVPDCHAMNNAAIDRLRGVNVIILDTLRYTPHPSHMSVAESLALLQKIGADRSYLIHLCHDLDHNRLQSQLPPNVFVSYDGQRLMV